MVLDNGMVFGLVKISNNATIPEAIVAAAIILAVAYLIGKIIG